MACIEVSNLRKEYQTYSKAEGFFGSVRSLVAREHRTVEAVRDISFRIETGEIVGFLGPNGAGKTTTLKMLSGILYPTSGTATILGYTPWERDPAFQRQFSIVMGQKNQLWWDLPPADSYRLFKEVYAIADRPYRKTLDELVTLLDVSSVINTPTRKLSLGQRMKCELIGALLHQPNVLLLDEPTIGLDLISQDNVRRFILDYNRQRQTTIMLTSHYMEDVKALAQRIIIINHGQLIYDDSQSNLTTKYGDIKSITLTFHEPVKRATLAKFGTVTKYSSRHATLDVPKSETPDRAAKLLRSLPVADIDIAKTEAEDIIRQIFLSTHESA
ncbi:ABC transporter ATP-binding protein [Candidatus Berkelbacteria bacterium]|nr:ABC transporter ATP-binding protein [Candidatus Berkelbacteria bacterium]